MGGGAGGAPPAPARLRARRRGAVPVAHAGSGLGAAGRRDEYSGALLWSAHRFRGRPLPRFGGAARPRRRARRAEGGVRVRAQGDDEPARRRTRPRGGRGRADRDRRSEEHTSELQSLMLISYAVVCLKKKTNHIQPTETRYIM